tara:strand:+ start:130 stop:339 length:210 start_codon:yes stop_codon:yes gene_type:complete
MKKGDLVEILNHRTQIRYERKDMTGEYGLITRGPEMFGFIQRCCVFFPKYGIDDWVDVMDLELAVDATN